MARKRLETIQMKRRIWIRRRDKIKQRYWVGRSRKKSYGAFKFLSPWQQLRQEGTVEPDYARFGTRKLRVGDEREILQLQKELSELQRRKKEREQLLKEEFEKPKKLKFEEEQPETKPKIHPEGKKILEIKRKAEQLTPEKIIQRHKTEAAQAKKIEKELEKEDPFEGFNLPDDVKSVAVKKLDSLFRKDPQGRNLGIDYLKKRALRLAEDELKGKQKVIPGVKTYEDSEYISEIEKLGLPKREAENIFFSMDPSDIKENTPQQLVKIVKQIPELGFSSGELKVTSRLSVPSQEEASAVLDNLLKHRPDLKKHNKITLINKLRSDVRDIQKEGMDINQIDLVAFFTHDKKLKDTLKDERKMEAS